MLMVEITAAVIGGFSVAVSGGITVTVEVMVEVAVEVDTSAKVALPVRLGSKVDTLYKVE